MQRDTQDNSENDAPDNRTMFLAMVAVYALVIAFLVLLNWMGM